MDDLTARQRARQFIGILVRVLDWAKDQPSHSSTYQIVATHTNPPEDGVDAMGDRIDDQPRGHTGRAFRELFVDARRADVITAEEAQAVQNLVTNGMKQRMAVDDYRSPNGEHWFKIRFEFRRNGQMRRLTVDSRAINRQAIDVPDGVTYETISEDPT